jgi:hypothetical protein
MQRKIIEGDKFRSPFAETIFEVKRIYTNTALLEDIGNKNHQLITEIATVISLYQKVDRP